MVKEAKDQAVSERLPVARVAVDISLAHLDRPFDYLVPAASGTWVTSTDGATDGWLQVEQYNPTTGLVEARFTF